MNMNDDPHMQWYQAITETLEQAHDAYMDSSQDREEMKFTFFILALRLLVEIAINVYRISVNMTGR